MTNNKKGWKSLFYLTPAGIIMLLFLIIPIAYTIYLSFCDWNLISPDKNFVGLRNYIQLFTDSTNLKVIFNTIIYIIFLLVLNLIVPYFISIIVQFFISKMKGAYKVLFFIPSLFSLVVGAMLFSWLLNPIAGPAAQVFAHFGMKLPQWTNSGGMAITVLCLISNWKVFGYNFILLLTGLGSIPENIINAAKIDNIPKWKMVKDVVLPMNKSIGMYVLIITVVQGLQYVFTPISVITQGGPNYGSSNVIYHTYLNAFVLYKTGNSAAMAIFTFIIFLIFLFLEIKFVEGKEIFENES